MEFSRQEYWSGLLFPSPGNLPDPEIKPGALAAPAVAGGFFTTEPPGKLGEGGALSDCADIRCNQEMLGHCLQHPLDICLLSFSPTQWGFLRTEVDPGAWNGPGHLMHKRPESLRQLCWEGSVVIPHYRPVTEAKVLLAGGSTASGLSTLSHSTDLLHAHYLN